jgi:hypothetical protein
MAAQLNTAGEEQGPAIPVQDTDTQHRDQVLRSENVAAGTMP